MAAAIGNEYAANARRWRSAIDKALENRCKSDGQQALIKIAERMLEAADAGESWAMKEIGDRLDGRPAQATVLEGGDKPLTIDGIARTIIDPAKHTDS